jgi:glycosyltransferase involved in cell wall biosynthesis
MNICMFTNTYLPHVGGVARSVRFFAEDLIDLGHRVLVVAPTFSDDKETSGKQPEVLRVPAIQQFNGSDFSVRIPLPLYVDQEIEQYGMEKLYRSLLNRHADSLPEVTAEIDPLEALSARIKTEWELWSLKTAAAADAIQSISE